MLGCSPTYAPPVRSTHDGAAGRLHRDEMQVAGSAGLFQNGGAWLTVPTGTDVKLELGGDFAPQLEWMMGWIGARYTFSKRQEGRWLGSGVAFDIEGGTGAGTGGTNGREDARDIDWDDRTAIGTYTGVGFAYHVAGIFAPWVRGRVQLTGAEDVPLTFWSSGLTGVELGYRIFHVYVGTGVAGYRNSVDSSWGWYPIEGGISFHYDFRPWE
jgi:hypothetical protein